MTRQAEPQPPQISQISKTLDPRLLQILVCPVSRGPLQWLPERQLLVSEQAGLAYPVRDGIPVMLADEALPWPDKSDPDN